MYLPSDKRYDKMIYSRCGRSGLKLPKVSMGLWQNFGHQGRFSDMEEMVHTAFDLGITHFDPTHVPSPQAEYPGQKHDDKKCRRNPISSVVNFDPRKQSSICENHFDRHMVRPTSHIFQLRLFQFLQPV